MRAGLGDGLLNESDLLSVLSLFLGLKSLWSESDDEHEAEQLEEDDEHESEQFEEELEPEHEDVNELRIASSDAINL